MTGKTTRRERVYVAAVAALTVLLFAFLLLFPSCKESLDGDVYELCEMLISRLLCGMIFLLLIPYLGYPLLVPRRGFLRGLLVSLPAFLVAVNNFPILGLLCGTVYVDAAPSKALLFTAACFAIGFFEEITFRGVIFPALLSRLLAFVRRRAKAGARIAPETVAVFLAIVLTSGIFGLVHVLNVFAGGSPLSVLLQVGYSFLIGGMCAIVLLKTRCIWAPVAVHAIYDLGGLLAKYLGGGSLWDTPTVILTVVLSLAVAAYFLVLLLRITPEEAEGLMKKV